MNIQQAIQIVEARYPNAVRTEYPDLVAWSIVDKDFALAYQDGSEHLMPMSNSNEEIGDCDILTELDLELTLDLLD